VLDPRNNDAKLDDCKKHRRQCGEFLTTNQGVRINDNQNSLKDTSVVRPLLEDFILREKITHFDHERIPERVVSCTGSRRMVIFRFTNRWLSIQSRIPADPAVKTPVFVRFSTVAGSRGSTDLARTYAVFAVKFYTEEGTSTSSATTYVFLFRTPIKFPDLIHA